MDIEQVTRNYLLFVILPLWLAAGAADWLCHRAARIEVTAGWRESAIHLLGFAEAGLPLLLALFFEINGLVIAIMAVCLIAHEMTSYWDVAFALRHRRVGPFEQRVHDYLGALPFMAFSFVLILHWPQAAALVGLGPEPLRLGLEPKRNPLPTAYIATLLAVILLLDLLPFLEEFLRGLRARRRLR